MNIPKLRWLLSIALLVGSVCAANEPDPSGKSTMSAQALKAEIDALRVERVPWREVKWESCLLAGLKQARMANKPVLCWDFIDRPADAGIDPGDVVILVRAAAHIDPVGLDADKARDRQPAGRVAACQRRRRRENAQDERHDKNDKNERTPVSSNRN